jgi:hypothetical protein
MLITLSSFLHFVETVSTLSRWSVCFGRLAISFVSSRLATRPESMHGITCKRPAVERAEVNSSLDSFPFSYQREYVNQLATMQEQGWNSKETSNTRASVSLLFFVPFRGEGQAES